MKARIGRDKKPAIISLIIGLAVAAIAPVAAYADTWPYFTTPLGTVFAGGGFNPAPSQSCSTLASDGYQAPDYGNVSTYKKGGILANGLGSAGSRSDAAATALGLIDNSGTEESFSTGQSGDRNSPYSLSFANTGDSGYPAPFGGGLFTGNEPSPTAYCLFDYFDTFAPSTFQSVGSNANIPTFSGNVYTGYDVGAGNFVKLDSGTTYNASTAGQKINIFIKGNLYINNNVTIGSYGTDANGTKIAFVVKGNIFISKAVTSLAGWYIAQPTTPSDTNTGYIYSCHDSDQSAVPDYAYIKANCTGAALGLKGAFYAKNLVLDRVSTAGSGLVGPTEHMDDAPVMHLGGPFFNPTSSGSTVSVDSIADLPPVF